jgi:hypothetical protein
MFLFTSRMEAFRVGHEFPKTCVQDLQKCFQFAEGLPMDGLYHIFVNGNSLCKINMHPHGLSMVESTCVFNNVPPFKFILVGFKLFYFFVINRKPKLFKYINSFGNFQQFIPKLCKTLNNIFNFLHHSKFDICVTLLL